MANKEYEIDTPAGKATVLLSDEEAKARGLTAKSKTADNKSQQPVNKSASSSKRDEAVGKAFNAPKKSGA